MKLYDLSQGIVELNDLMETGEYDPQTLQDTLDGLQMLFDEKVDNIVKLIRSKEAEAEALKSEEERLANRRKSITGQVDWLEKYLLTNMEATGNLKVKTPLFSVAVRENKGVTILDEKLIPEAFKTIVTETKVSKTEIAKHFKDGLDVPGASYGVVSRTVNIR